MPPDEVVESEIHNQLAALRLRFESANRRNLLNLINAENYIVVNYKANSIVSRFGFSGTPKIGSFRHVSRTRTRVR
jgi:hypothetical protein